MITDLEEIKRLLRTGYQLRNTGNGWNLGRLDAVPADLVALLAAQGFISTDLRVVGSARWVAK